MDIATIVGIIVAFSGLIWAMYEQSEGQLGTFFSKEAVVVVIAGSAAAGLMSLPMKTIKDIFGILKKWFFAKVPPVNDLVKQMVGYAEVARRDGMLALEDAVKKQPDPFLRKGLQLAIDGTDPEIIEHTLQLEIEALGERHKNGKKFFETVGAYGPGFGLTATLIGQIAMFKNLGTDIKKIGAGLSLALCATLYGCIICNAICGPIANKLGIRSAEEQFIKEMILVGIMSIQAGDNPHVVEMKMLSFLSEKERQTFQKRK